MSAPQKRRRKLYLEPGQNASTIPRTTKFYQSNPRQRALLHDNTPAEIEEHHQGVSGNQNVASASMEDPHTDPDDTPAIMEDPGTEPDDVVPILIEALPTDVDENEVNRVEENEERVPCIGICVCGQCMNDLNPQNNLQQEEGYYCPQTATNDPKFNEKYEWDKPLFSGIKTTKFETFLMILHLSIRYGMTGPFIEDMLKFVNCIVGETVLQTSRFIFNKLFAPKSILHYHYFCPTCEFYLGEKSTMTAHTVQCSNCEQECDVQSFKDGNFFITLSMRTQLEDLLAKPDVKIIPHLDRNQDFLCDIIDGSLYQSLCTEGRPMCDANSLSIIFNTDGAPVFRSTKSSIWPIQFFINEISPEQRFRHENVLLYGIWFGESAPSMSSFMKPFIQEMKELAVNGVRRQKDDGSIVACPVFAIGCTVDSVAKPKVQMSKQFNGTFGCGLCLHPGLENVPGAGTGVRYSTCMEGYPYPYRTDSGMRNDMIEAETLKERGLLRKGRHTLDHVNGVKGYSPLCALPAFHIVHGFPIDYMHALLAGVAERTTGLWFDSSSHGKEYYIGPAEEDVDAVLLNITPPQTLSCVPIKMSKRSEYKCKDWKSWLLFYSVICVQDILPRRYLENWKLLVSAAHILLRDKISYGALSEADTMLQKFVKSYNELYSDVNMVYNIHLCSHLAHNVSLWGPLWAYSAFSFESGNGHIKKLISGTRGVVTQIAQKYVVVKFVDQFMTNRSVSKRVLDFCGDIITYSYLKKSEVFGDVIVLGSGSLSAVTDEEKYALQQHGHEVTYENVRYFNRAVRKQQVYYSKVYKKPKNLDDTCIHLTNDRYAVSEKIFELPGSFEIWVFIRPIRISQSNHLVPHIKTCSQDMFAPLEVIPFSAIRCKCVRIQTVSKNYVCDIPNVFEKD